VQKHANKAGIITNSVTYDMSSVMGQAGMAGQNEGNSKRRGKRGNQQPELSFLLLSDLLRRRGEFHMLVLGSH
jgi:hypothetical protein